MTSILYLHGAGSTPLSFKYIEMQLPKVDSYKEYMKPNESAREIAERIKDKYSDVDNLNIIAHSLGGIVAVNLMDMDNVDRLVTLSTPFGGHVAAIVMSVWSSDAMFKDLSPLGSTIRNIQNVWNKSKKPHLALVTNSGFECMGFENDGVVTVASQKYLSGPLYKMLDINHFEVLLSDDAVEEIKDFIF